MPAAPDTRRREETAHLLHVLELAGELEPGAIMAKACATGERALPGYRFFALRGDGNVHGSLGRLAVGPHDRRALEGWGFAGGAQAEAPQLNDLPRPLAAAVMQARGERHGVLVASGPSRLAAQDHELVEAIAGHAAVALANARLLARREALARRDPLTGLLNHREFHEGLASELERCRRRGGASTLGLISLDLDDFKLINDTAGHAAGDRLLRAVAGALAGACRAGDAAFRVGGDEFALLLADTRADGAAAVAARAREAIIELHPMLGVSFGVACWPEDGPTRDGLLARADERLYAMKRGGRGGGRRVGGRSVRRGRHAVRLRVASTLTTLLGPLGDPTEIARVTVDELHRSFHYYLAVIQRLDPDQILRVVAAAGPLSESSEYLAYEQHLHEGVNGRVARTGEPAAVPNTHREPDYLSRDSRTDPGSELSFPIRVGGRVWGVLNLEEVAAEAFDEADVLLADTVAAQVGAAVHRGELMGRFESAVTDTLSALAGALEASDPYTAEHGRAVADLAVAIGCELALSGAEQRALQRAALLHDVGKIGISRSILHKPGPLTAAEFREMQRHSEIGQHLLQNLPGFELASLLVRGVHERWDGGGYPDGLVGERTPLGARILAVCDAFHAMTSDRSYRRALPLEEALAELDRHAGTQFDPVVVDAVRRAHTDIASPGVALVAGAER